MTLRQPLDVAIIGAGISGVVTAAHLLRKGANVTVFERNSEAGGVWLFDERAPPEPYYPSILPSKGEEYPVELEIDGYPGPCHPGLKNNVGTRLMKTTLQEWPENTPDIVTHDIMKQYIQKIAAKWDVEHHVRYQTSVTDVAKNGDKWTVASKPRRKDSLLSGARSVSRGDNFDAVIVSTGHYNSPRIPDLPGLSKLKALFPDRISHSKGYRGPELYAGKVVLLIGSGASALDVGREVAPIANRLFHSHRGGAFDVPLAMFPKEVAHIGEIDRLELIGWDESSNELSELQGALPIKAQLRDGSSLCNIDYIVMCTGYHISLPFLVDFHRDDVPAVEADETTLVTDGTMYHNLYQDIFYIPDPSLAFVGVPYYSATFSLFDFQAQVVAEVLSGNANLPDQQRMREEYTKKIKDKGAGKQFHSVRGVEVEYVSGLLEWVNPQLEAVGAAPIARHTPAWLSAKEEMIEKMKALFGENDNIREQSVLASKIALNASCNEVVTVS